LKTNSRSIPSLDGLRGVAVVLVIIAHLGLIDRAHAFLSGRGIPLLPHLFEFDAGDLGVSVFFVISGYLITTLLVRQSEASGTISLKTFYLRRLFRIFPPVLLLPPSCWAYGRERRNSLPTAHPGLHSPVWP
jgi:peptidoglycan/LPS O-acetylase OafA/YrhL